VETTTEDLVYEDEFDHIVVEPIEPAKVTPVPIDDITFDYDTLDETNEISTTQTPTSTEMDSRKKPVNHNKVDDTANKKSRAKSKCYVLHLYFSLLIFIFL